jgi:hypothetical protein
MKTLITLFICFQTLVVFSQNLVPNGSFEDFSSCPAFLDNIEDCNDWMNFSGTCDYYNACAENGSMDVPNNPLDTQEALDGNAYAGFAAIQTTTTDYREFLTCSIGNGLEIGTTYFFSMHVSRAEGWGFLAVKNIGMNLTTSAFSEEVPFPITNDAKVVSTNMLDNGQLWMQVKGSFVADSAYQYLMIGNFFNDANTEYIPMAEVAFGAYYYVDEVRLSTDSAYAHEALFIPEEKQPFEISFYPNPVDEQLIIDSKGIIDFVLYDSSGRSIKFDRVRPYEQKLILYLSNLSNGFYNLTLFYENGNVTSIKILKN